MCGLGSVVVQRHHLGMEASSSRKRAAEGEVDGVPSAQKHQTAAAAAGTASESVVFPSGDFSSCTYAYWGDDFCASSLACFCFCWVCGGCERMGGLGRCHIHRVIRHGQQLTDRDACCRGAGRGEWLVPLT